MTARLTIVSALALASCHPPGGTARPGAGHVESAEALTFAHVLGTWEWTLATDAPGQHRVEHERWHLAPDPAAPAGAFRAIGAYDRDVEIRSTDGVPFSCDEQPVYHQRARFAVEVAIDAAGVTVTETAYRVEPSPCDRTFRKLGVYRAQVDGDRITLAWDGGTQTLARAADAQPLPDPPVWPGVAPRWDGAWSWSAHTMDDDGNLRDEREDWQIATGDDGHASATYVRTVTTTSIDARPLACSGTRRWTYVDRYVLDGHLDGGLLTLTEVASEPGAHPCLAPTPARALDALTAEQDGAFLDLEWRGKRRQVLHRPPNER